MQRVQNFQLGGPEKLIGADDPRHAVQKKKKRRKTEVILDAAPLDWKVNDVRPSALSSQQSMEMQPHSELQCDPASASQTNSWQKQMSSGHA